MAIKRSHHKIKLNTKNIHKVAEQMAVRQQGKMQRAGLKAMKELRETSVIEWYTGLMSGTNAYEAMNIATEYDASDLIWRGKRAYIRIYSGIDIQKYQEHMLAYHRAYDNSHHFSSNGRSSLENWKYRHIQNVACGKTYGEYMFELKWNKGIYGLPERAIATGSGWVNKRFISGYPLESYMTTKIARNWRNTVNKYLGKK